MQNSRVRSAARRLKNGNEQLEFTACIVQEALCCTTGKIGAIIAFQLTWEVMLCQAGPQFGCYENLNPWRRHMMVVEEQLIPAKSAIRTRCVNSRQCSACFIQDGLISATKRSQIQNFPCRSTSVEVSLLSRSQTHEGVSADGTFLSQSHIGMGSSVWFWCFSGIASYNSPWEGVLCGSPLCLCLLSCTLQVCFHWSQRFLPWLLCMRFGSLPISFEVPSASTSETSSLSLEF